MIHLQADQNLYKLEAFLSDSFDLHPYNPSSGLSLHSDTQALLVRTVTKVNQTTLPSLPKSLKFVATGSSGSDHIDKEYLETNAIQVADAKGCNARAVAEYVMTSLLLWKEENKIPAIPKVGIVGAGKVGTAVHQMLDLFDVDHILYDPPREQREPGFESATLEEVLKVDILSLHTPLSYEGKHPTYHWLDEEKLRSHSFKLIINAARGGVADEHALLKAKNNGTVGDFILDVWEGEPDFNEEAAREAYIATPHIAGYSEQAKVQATAMIVQAMYQHFDLNLPDSSYESIPQDIQLAELDYTLKELLTRLHPILQYDEALRDLMGRPDKQTLFAGLRTNWPYRFEYPMMRIRGELLTEFPELRKLGIRSLF